MQAQAGCTEYNAFVVRGDCIVQVRRKYLKGLLSIPSHGRGARRPLGQSFHKSVGRAAEALRVAHFKILLKNILLGRFVSRYAADR